MSGPMVSWIPSPALFREVGPRLGWTENTPIRWEGPATLRRILAAAPASGSVTLAPGTLGGGGTAFWSRHGHELATVQAEWQAEHLKAMVGQPGSIRSVAPGE